MAVIMNLKRLRREKSSVGEVRLHFFRHFGDRDGVNVCSEKSNIYSRYQVPSAAKTTCSDTKKSVSVMWLRIGASLLTNETSVLSL